MVGFFVESFWGDHVVWVFLVCLGSIVEGGDLGLVGSNGFFCTLLPFGEVVLDLLVDPRVQFEGNYSSLDVVSFLGVSECRPWCLWFGCRRVLYWLFACFEFSWVFGSIWGVQCLVCFVCEVAFLPPVVPIEL